MRTARIALISLLLTAFTGCAGGPQFDTRDVDSSLTVTKVAASGAEHRGARVVWGGVIVTTRNRADYTELEVLSYPLDEAQRPDTSSPAQGRFLARYPHYLEAIDYAPGRSVTITGSVEKTLSGKVGDAPYTFPLIKADALYLWPRSRSAPSSTQFHFGVGVIFGG